MSFKVFISKILNRLQIDYIRTWSKLGVLIESHNWPHGLIVVNFYGGEGSGVKTKYSGIKVWNKLL